MFCVRQRNVPTLVSISRCHNSLMLSYNLEQHLLIYLVLELLQWLVIHTDAQVLLPETEYNKLLRMTARKRGQAERSNIASSFHLIGKRSVDTMLLSIVSHPHLNLETTPWYRVPHHLFASCNQIVEVTISRQESPTAQSNLKLFPFFSKPKRLLYDFNTGRLFVTAANKNPNAPVIRDGTALAF